MYGFISLQQTKKGAKPAGKRGKGKKKSALKYIIDCYSKPPYFLNTPILYSQTCIKGHSMESKNVLLI
jgi:hypothetical protein